MIHETEIEPAIEEKIIETPDDPNQLLREARKMIPVGKAGATPTDFSQQVDYARDMAKANVTIPNHLKRQVGDCLAIVDIAMRSGLSPYMVANKTYVQNGRLQFESQLYHVFAQASGLLKGDLLVEYENDGDELVCIVTGYLRVDPFKPRVHGGEPLKKAHPGHVEKDGKKFVKGSPLWDRKPKVQLFYDTSGHWVRIYCPQATLGIYTLDEMEEYGPDFARDVSPVGLHDRLTASEKSEQGHRQGHTASQLDHIVGKGQVIGHKPRTSEESQPAALQDGGPEPGAMETPPDPIKRIRGRPKGSGKGQKAEKEPEAPVAQAEVSYEKQVENAMPATPKEYLTYATHWINQTDDSVSIGQRWNAERSLRNKIGMVADETEQLQLMISKKLSR